MQDEDLHGLCKPGSMTQRQTAKVVERRFGLNNRDVATLEEVGADIWCDA